MTAGAAGPRVELRPGQQRGVLCLVVAFSIIFICACGTLRLAGQHIPVLPLFLTAVSAAVAHHGLRRAAAGSSARRTRQGFPAATTPGGMSRVTTLPAPIVVPAPIVTPGQTIAPPPSYTSAPMLTGAASSRPERRTPGSTGWVAA